MCGRFTSSQRREAIGERFEVAVPETYQHRFNLAPQQRALIIRERDDSREAVMAKWGLLPHWAKDSKIAFKMINARAETLTEKPAYRSLIGKYRCLIPADGFYEWRRDGNARVPMWICLKNREPFTFPALWDCWIDRDTAKALYTFTIITTQPNDLMRPIHNLMPVIYDPAMGQQWLERSFAHSPLRLKSALQPLRSSQMQAYEVSSLVNSPENDSSECIRPISQSEKKEQLRLL